jgi:putative CocE/NonD family hydrolase
MQSFRPNATSYLKEVLQHEPYDSFWQERTLSDYQYVNFPAVHVAGWYDLFLRNSLLTFENYNTLSATGALGKQKLIVGPRGHCLFFRANDNLWFPNDFYDVVWGYETSLEIFGAKQKLPHLWKTTTVAAQLQTYTLYVMGSRLDTILPSYVGNYWTTLSSLPTPTNLTLYFGAAGSLSETSRSSSSVYTYLYDPANPVPSLCGNDIPIGGGTCGPCDQRPVENRTDVVLFETVVLQEPLVVLGPVSASLFVSSNCTDTDFMLKITDVYPSGESIIITDQILRMRWRNVVMEPPAPTYFPPMPISPKQIYSISFETWPFLQVFNKGHKIRVAITSSNSPRFNPTPNNGKLVYQGGPIYTAMNSFYTGPSTPSSLVFPTVTLEQVPPNVNIL